MKSSFSRAFDMIFYFPLIFSYILLFRLGTDYALCNDTKSPIPFLLCNKMSCVTILGLLKYNRFVDLLLYLCIIIQMSVAIRSKRGNVLWKNPPPADTHTPCFALSSASNSASGCGRTYIFSLWRPSFDRENKWLGWGSDTQAVITSEVA